MARSNLEDTQWVVSQPMSADFATEAINLRDTGQADGIIQVAWSGFDTVDGRFEVQISHIESLGWSKLCPSVLVSSASGSEVFVLTVSGLVLLRLAFFHGTGSAGTFSATYFLKGH